MLPFQNLVFKRLTEFKNEDFQNPQVMILADFKM